MKKRKTRRTAASSPAKPLSVPSVSGAIDRGEEQPFWRGLAAEPVALGLALIVVLRPWRDGLTFTAFNAYYFAVALALGAVWCARGILRPAPLRSPVPLALLSAFAAVAWLTGYASYSYDPSIHGLQRIAIYLVLFVLASNGLRTRRAVTILLGAIVVGWLLNSIWTIFHFNVMLSGMRRVLRDYPQLLQQYFGVPVPGPELKHRIESNRAFGTFLFPNALGAYLILGIPVAAALLPNALATLRSIRDLPRPAPPPEESMRAPALTADWVALGIGFGVTSVWLTILYFGNTYIGMANPGQVAPIPGPYWPFLYFVPIAAVIGAAAGWFVHTRGAKAFGRLCMGLGIFFALAASLISLWLSYSRGAIFALVAAGTLAAALANAARLPWKLRVAPAAVMMAVLAGALISASHGQAQDGEGYRIPDPVPTALGYEERRHEEASKEMHVIRLEGSKRELGSLGDLSTLKLRVTYWQVGMKIFLGNFWTGVGLGNFQTAYPKYQFLGAGDVETAHNDFLQYFCETGVFGGGLFLAFWVYFGVWGARRILVEPDAETRRWLAGAYAGALGFVAHSLMDFNFQNPGLAMEAYIVAGLFYAISTLRETPARETFPGHLAAGRIAAAFAGVVVLVGTSSVLRLYLFDLGLTEERGFLHYSQVGDRKPLKAQLETANDMWQGISPMPSDKPIEKNALPAVRLVEALRVVPSLDALKSVGVLRVPVTDVPGKWRAVEPLEPLTSNMVLVFTGQEMPRARQLLAEACERRIAWLVKWDESYPHDPEISNQIFSWYDVLYTRVPDPAAKRRYAIEAERWAKASVDRSPQAAYWWLNYGKALWMRAAFEPDKAKIEYYRTGLAYYRRARELYPRSPMVTKQLGDALQNWGTGLVKAGRADEGNPILAEAQAMYDRAGILDRYDDLVR